MIVLDSIANKVALRPGIHDYEIPYLIPDTTDGKEFWDHQYQQLQACNFISPVSGEVSEYIDPAVGYFGLRTHPLDDRRPYYHIGIELTFKTATKVTPLASGVLEHSGYGAINGHYILLSHPDIVTEDGYVLHTMYCHLKKPLITFTSYQKMLREISLGSYPIIPVTDQEVLGVTGNSGVVQGGNPKLYIQMDFRKYGEDPIVIDPFRVLAGVTKENTSLKQLRIRG